jgi:hypothetical protein
MEVCVGREVQQRKATGTEKKKKGDATMTPIRFRRPSVRSHYDKPLSLRLQWILKEIREKAVSMESTHQRTKDGRQ